MKNKFFLLLYMALLSVNQLYADNTTSRSSTLTFITAEPSESKIQQFNLNLPLLIGLGERVVINDNMKTYSITGRVFYKNYNKIDKVVNARKDEQQANERKVNKEKESERNNLLSKNEMKTISNEHLTIKVSPQGAELCSIFANGKEYLWQADPAFWQRHSPILFPIVGSVWENKYRHEGITYTLTQHGFARDMEFTLITEKSDEVRFQLLSNEETLSKYPFPFCLEIGYRLKGKQIEVIWEVKNPGNKVMHFQIGAHPGFYYPDFDPSTEERGYLGFDKAKNLKYILTSEKGCADSSTDYSLKLTDGLLPLDTQTFDKDALIIENEQIHEVTLYNKNKKAYLSLYFNAPVVGLWSPPTKNAPFICIEPWYGRCDQVNFKGEYKDRDWMNHLEPGDSFKSGYIIEINE